MADSTRNSVSTAKSTDGGGAGRPLRGIDRLLTHPFLGLALFVAIMLGVFYCVFIMGAPLQRLVDLAVRKLGEAIIHFWPPGSAGVLKSLVFDGILGGVGAVLVFLPNVVLLFFWLAVLQECGYLARGVLLMDQVMRRLGLHGHSFVPLLVGFGCSVPAIMATRSLHDRRDRLVTMLIIPYMSCSAQLPIYMMVIPAFFAPLWQAPLLWLTYVGGILLAMIMARVLRRTLLKGEPQPPPADLPPFRWPSPRPVLWQTWGQTRPYLRKVGTIILLIAVIMWAMSSFPRLSDEQRAALSSPDEVKRAELARCYAGRLGQAVAPALKPLGFDWRITTALVPAFATKEAFVTQMGILFNLGEVHKDNRESLVRLQAELRRHYTPLVGLCVVIFILLSAPCMSTIAVTWRESGHWKWAALQFAGHMAVGYLVTLVIYQLGTLLGLGTRQVMGG